MGGEFACQQAASVVRRGGPDIACQAQAAHQRCESLLLHLQAAALPAMGFTGDLESTPHSALVKIQFGGLLGLLHQLEGINTSTVANVDALVLKVEQQHAVAEAVLAPDIINTILDYKLRTRRGRP